MTASTNSSQNLTYFAYANGTSLNIDKHTGQFTWFVNSNNFRLTFKVVDSNNGTASISPIVQLCYCLNGGVCNPSVVNEEARTVNNLLTYEDCICPLGHVGAYCEEKIEFCLEDPCFEGVNCTNNATALSADCGPCPYGYVGDGRKCAGALQNVLFNFASVKALLNAKQDYNAGQNKPGHWQIFVSSWCLSEY